MTVALSAESPRRAAARRFSVELRRAMAARRIGRRRLAECLETSDSMVAQWRSGRTLPRLDTTIRLARALEWETLVAIVRESREGRCHRCGNTFINEGGTAQLYCSDRCRRAQTKLVAHTDTRARAAASERQLKLIRSAVDAMCRSCEPEGYCRTLDCPLRAVSPLPAWTDPRKIREATPAPGPYGTAANRERTLAAIREANARRWGKTEVA